MNNNYPQINKIKPTKKTMKAVCLNRCFTRLIIALSLCIILTSQTIYAQNQDYIILVDSIYREGKIKFDKAKPTEVTLRFKKEN